MITYRDRTFCEGSDDCPFKDCFSNFTEEHKIKANEWALTLGLKEPPVAFSDYQVGCRRLEDNIKPKEEKENE
jgi:hypothetical protein